MLPDPLHPAIVHFPVVLSVLVPLVAGGALWAIKLGSRPLRAWGVTTAVAAALAASAWLAVETGEQQEERVGDTIGETRVEQHASAGETLLFTSAGVLVVIALGLMPGTAGRVARYAGAVGTLTLGVAAYQVGHSGGELVYKYNAGAAYASDSTGAGGGLPADAAADSLGAPAGGMKGEQGERGERGERGEKGERGER